MKQVDALTVLGPVNAVLTNDHFVYTSGRHGEVYVNKDEVYTDPQATYQLACGLAERCVGELPEVVVAPAVGGALLAQWTAYRLSQLLQRKVLATYAERQERVLLKADSQYRFTLAGEEHRAYGNDEVVLRSPSFVLKRGYDAKVRGGKRVVIVEDILTTGGTACKVVETTRQAGGYVLCVLALVNRGGVTAAQLGDVPRLEALVDIKLASWKAEDCPFCKEGRPINIKVGKGKDFVALPKLGQ